MIIFWKYWFTKTKWWNHRYDCKPLRWCRMEISAEKKQNYDNHQTNLVNLIEITEKTLENFKDLENAIKKCQITGRSKTRNRGSYCSFSKIGHSLGIYIIYKVVRALGRSAVIYLSISCSSNSDSVEVNFVFPLFGIAQKFNANSWQLIVGNVLLRSFRFTNTNECSNFHVWPCQHYSGAITLTWLQPMSGGWLCCRCSIICKLNHSSSKSAVNFRNPFHYRIFKVLGEKRCDLLSFGGTSWKGSRTWLLWWILRWNH